MRKGNDHSLEIDVLQIRMHGSSTMLGKFALDTPVCDQFI